MPQTDLPFMRQPLAGVVVDDREHPQRPAADELVMSEVQSPTLTHLQMLLAVKPVDAFVVIGLSVALEQDR